MKVWAKNIRIRYEDGDTKDDSIPVGLWYSNYDTLEPADQNIYLTDKDLKGAVAVNDPNSDDHAFDLLRLKTGQFVYAMGIDLEYDQCNG
jgi:hypothetical protein